MTALCVLAGTNDGARAAGSTGGAWAITTTRFVNNFQAEPYVGNGYFSQRIPAVGMGFLSSPRPDPATKRETPFNFLTRLGGLTLNDLQWQGRAFTVAIGPATTTVHLSSGAAMPIITPAGRQTVAPGGTIVIPTRAQICS